MGAVTTSRFVAMWPITDETLPFLELVNQATPDLHRLTNQAHARIVGGGRWTVAESAKVPGSGRVTKYVLIYDAPAAAKRPRARKD